MALPDRGNSTNYTHPQENNLLNVHKGMEYDGQGRPVLRTVLSPTSLSSGSSAFGEPIAIPITPVVQLDALYGLDPQEFQTYTFSSGVIETTGTLFKVHTGTSAYGYSVIRSNRIIRYRPGQGALLRFTAAFENPQTGVSLRAGFISQEQSIAVGYNGTRFGVLRANGGKAQIMKLTVDTSAVGTTTITLNGAATTVALSSTNTTTAAQEIAATTFTGWITEQVDNTVFFASTSLGPLSGTYSMTVTGSGTFTTIKTGVAQTEHWTYQEDFDVDTLDGAGTSGITIDTSKLNVFTIDFRWLGVGEIRYGMENPNTGDVFYFHHEHFSNRYTDVHTDNPSFRVGWVAYNSTGNTITDAHVTGASIMAAIEGIREQNAFTTAINSPESGSLIANVVHHVISIKNRTVHQGKFSLRLNVMRRLSISFQGNDPALIYLFLNPTLSVNHNFTDIADYSSSLVCTATGTITLANEKPLAVYTLQLNGADTFDLEDLALSIPPGNILSVGIQSGQVMNGVISGLTWVEL